jgi:nitrite reductase/ring-hydroxylating ferredoxin subunit
MAKDIDRYNPWREKGISLLEGLYPDRRIATAYLHLRCIYQDSLEPDFYSDNKWLIECKFHDEAFSAKRGALFNSFPAKEKYV